MASIGVEISLETVFVTSSSHDKNPFHGIRCALIRGVLAQHLCFMHAVQAAVEGVQIHIITDEAESLHLHCDVCVDKHARIALEKMEREEDE